jgi:hypothetical protein
MSTAVKTTRGLCVGCKARRDAAQCHADVIVTRTSEDAPYAWADRDHVMRITTWTACPSCCSGRAS